MADNNISGHKIFEILFSLIFIILNLFVLVHLVYYFTLASGSYFDLISNNPRDNRSVGNLTICLMLGLGLPYLLISLILLFDFRALILFMASINGLGLFFAMLIETTKLGQNNSWLPLLLLLAIVICSFMFAPAIKVAQERHVHEAHHQEVSHQSLARIQDQQTTNQDVIPLSSLIVELPETAVITQSYGFATAPPFEQAIDQGNKDFPPAYKDCLPPSYEAVVKNGDQIY